MTSGRGQGDTSGPGKGPLADGASVSPMRPQTSDPHPESGIHSEHLRCPPQSGFQDVLPAARPLLHPVTWPPWTGLDLHLRRAGCPRTQGGSAGP